MKNPLIWFALVMVFLIALAVYRSRTSPDHMNVEPHAAKEIEKAKGR